MCRERPGVESETKPLPAHAIFAGAVQTDVGPVGGDRSGGGSVRGGEERLEVKDRGRVTTSSTNLSGIPHLKPRSKIVIPGHAAGSRKSIPARPAPDVLGSSSAAYSSRYSGWITEIQDGTVKTGCHTVEVCPYFNSICLHVHILYILYYQNMF